MTPMTFTEQKEAQDLIFHLEKAIESDEFEVYYQPIIHTISGSLCGFEALVRWHHPQYGFLNPTQFIPALEDTRQIYHLDIQLVEKVCERWQTETKAGRPTVPVSVNLSRHDFVSMDMFRAIEDIVYRYSMPRNMLNIEVTESAFAENEQLMQTTIQRFRGAGYQVWMDDFGSGYSSLNTLKDYEFDELKIDMRFLSDMRYKSRRIISAMVNMAKNIGMVTLAEGVETEEQVRFLRSIGCDRLQGYYFSRPLPYERVTKILKDKKIPFETEEDRRYYHEVNRINLLSPSPFTVKDAAHETHGGGIPLTIMEKKNGAWEFIYKNDEFDSCLEVIGATDAMDAIQRLVHFGILTYVQIHEYLSGVISDGDRKIDFSVDGDMCSARGKLISSSADRKAVLLSITNITQAMDINHEQYMDSKLKNIYSLYLRVSVLRPEKNELTTIFTQDHYNLQTDIPVNLRGMINWYSGTEVMPPDREVYKQFIDPETLEVRIRESSRGFINTKVHTRDADGSFSNKMYLAVAMGNHEVLILVRYANL